MIFNFNLVLCSLVTMVYCLLGVGWLLLFCLVYLCVGVGFFSALTVLSYVNKVYFFFPNLCALRVLLLYHSHPELVCCRTKWWEERDLGCYLMCYPQVSTLGFWGWVRSLYSQWEILSFWQADHFPSWVDVRSHHIVLCICCFDHTCL